ncbi:hypothetical protein C8J56DRAFT_939325 [Mycena floridula]|nr:hypothetical protein C8J56DRAFT_939325 [Mycena floridula]
MRFLAVFILSSYSILYSACLQINNRVHSVSYSVHRQCVVQPLLIDYSIHELHPILCSILNVHTFVVCSIQVDLS